jgi:trans-2,3-dihydro-3-hydroxyanthranilate isomerase
LNARMFCYENHQVVEDAATGSGAGCLLGYLLKHHHKTTVGELNLLVEQGYQMKRPSLLELHGKILNEQELQIEVGGRVQLVARGEWG